MANWSSYAYCDKCDRPLRASETRLVETGSGNSQTTTFYCRLCGDKARGFQKILGLPFSLFGAFSLAVMELVMYFQQGFSFSEMINLPFPTIELVPVLAFVGYFYWKKSKCKPIYDRWVHQHGTDPDKWPPAPNSDRTSEKWTKSESPSKLEKYGFVAVIILAVAVIAYLNLKYGWFEWLEDSRFR